MVVPPWTPAPKSKLGKTKIIVWEISSGHFGYTNFWAPDPPPLSHLSSTSLPSPHPRMWYPPPPPCVAGATGGDRRPHPLRPWENPPNSPPPPQKNPQPHGVRGAVGRPTTRPPVPSPMSAFNEGPNRLPNRRWLPSDRRLPLSTRTPPPTFFFAPPVLSHFGANF